MNRLLHCLVAALLAFPAASFAQEARTAAIVIVHPWARSTPPVAKTGAVYLTIRNDGATDDRLVGLLTGVADSAEMHVTETADGVSRMRQLKGMDIAAGSTAIFTPGQAHVMLVGLKAPLVAGQVFPLTLIFEKAGPVDARVEVTGRGNAPAGHGH